MSQPSWRSSLRPKGLLPLASKDRAVAALARAWARVTAVVEPKPSSCCLPPKLYKNVHRRLHSFLPETFGRGWLPKSEAWCARSGEARGLVVLGVVWMAAVFLSALTPPPVLLIVKYKHPPSLCRPRLVIVATDRVVSRFNRRPGMIGFGMAHRSIS